MGGDFAQSHPQESESDSPADRTETENSGGGEVECLWAGGGANLEGAAKGGRGMVRRHLRERRGGASRGGNSQEDPDPDRLLAGRGKAPRATRAYSDGDAR